MTWVTLVDGYKFSVEVEQGDVQTSHPVRLVKFPVPSIKLHSHVC